MTTATYTLPDFSTDDAADYKAYLDGNAKVAERSASMFACHEQTVPAMTVRVDAGFLWNGSTLTEVVAQSTGTITAPSVNPRIDRVILDPLTGVVSVVTGAEAASPSAPAITAGKLPLCQVALATSTTEITNSLITDERVIGAGGGGGTDIVTEITGNTTLTASHLGQTIYISDGDADVTMPALSAFAVGGLVRFVSGTAKRQRIYAAAGESMEGVTSGFYRLPSYESCTIQKVSASLWRVRDRPTHPVGATIEWSGSAGTVAEVAGPGWVEISTHNATLSRTTYKNLFDVVATTWGVGDGSTTFGLPAEPGRSTVAAGTASGLTTRALAASGGEETHANTVAETPAHAHPGSSVSGSTDSGGSHVHQETVFHPSTGVIGAQQVGTSGGTPIFQVAADNSQTANTINTMDTLSGGTHSHGISASVSIASQGSGSAHNTMHPFLVKKKLIKV